jgi:carbamoyl-phosphate synthase large subunit
MVDRTTVLIAGIGGASLGTELAKCLSLCDGYRVLGCDISPLAFGHYDQRFDQTFVVDRSAYVDSVLAICKQENVAVILPGADEPTVLLADEADRFSALGIGLAINHPSVVQSMSRKDECFSILASLGFVVPRTVTINDEGDLKAIPLPCIVKPSSGSGGSAFVCFARTKNDAWLFAERLKATGRLSIAQEYLPLDGGEFTVGVLSFPNGKVVGSIAMRRAFDSKLSIASRGDDYLISSGYSQGLIDDFPDVRLTAERIALSVGSKGPINIQGRVWDGVFVPFEINPRFSASVYLRALAGFNEVAIYLDFLLRNIEPKPCKIRPGWYLRSLSEIVVPREGLRT